MCAYSAVPNGAGFGNPSRMLSVYVTVTPPDDDGGIVSSE